MYDNILNRPLRFIGNVSERARNLIEQVSGGFSLSLCIGRALILSSLAPEKDSQ